MFAWEQLTFESFVHIYSYVLTFGVLKLLVTFYVGKFIAIAVPIGVLCGVWEVGILAYLLKRILYFGYWKFGAGLVVSAIVVGLGMVLFAPGSLPSSAFSK